MSGALEADGDSVQNPLAGRSGFQRDLLVVLDGLGAVRGQVVMDEIQKWGYEESTHPRLYANLDTLNDVGLVEKRVNEPDSRSNLYEITDDGKEACRAYLLSAQSKVEA